MPTDRSNLEPLDPETGAEMYLDHKATDCTEATVQNHRYRMKHFLTWCEEEGVDNLNDLTGRDIQRYRLWIADHDDINKVTRRNMLSSFRVFLEWAGSIEAVPESLYSKLMIPRVRRSEQSNEDILKADEAEARLDHLSQYEYASIDHVILAVLWDTGMRVGALHSLDVSDIDFENEHVQLVHRRKQGTTLKNGRSGERLVALPTTLTEMLQDHIDKIRYPTTDECDREPLLTSRHGRLSRNTIRRRVYKITAPCFVGNDCPDCRQGGSKKCPEAVGPHAIRRGSITHYLTQDIPIEVVSDRMNVSRKVLDTHYDKRSEEVKLEQRRGYVDDI